MANNLSKEFWQNDPERPYPFWQPRLENLFPDEPTPIFDITFGIIAPILCLLFDPFLFKGDFLQGCRSRIDDIPITSQYFAIFAYTLVGLGILTLVIWLVFGRRAGHAAAFFAGVFFTGAESALALGIAMVPLSLVGLMIGIGIFGFTPLLTALVYLRNAVHAWRMAFQQTPPKPHVWIFSVALIATLFIYTIPALVQWQAWMRFPEISIPAPPPLCSSDP